MPESGPIQPSNVDVDGITTQFQFNFENYATTISIIELLASLILMAIVVLYYARKVSLLE